MCKLKEYCVVFLSSLQIFSVPNVWPPEDVYHGSTLDGIIFCGLHILRKKKQLAGWGKKIFGPFLSRSHISILCEQIVKHSKQVPE